MNSQLYRKLHYTGATLLILLLLGGADCGVLESLCNYGPGNARRTLAGTNASIVLVSPADNGTYALTIENPDPYLGWQEDLDFGNHSVTCFMDCWKATYGNNWQQATVWLGSEEPLAAEISSLRLSGGVITGILTRPNRFYPALTGSGDIVIAINKSYSAIDPCQGLDVYLSENCFQPFMNFVADRTAISIPGAHLNFSSFAGADLRNSDFRGTTLSYASFAGADLRGVNFSGAVMVYTDLTGADMRDVKMGNARVYKTIAPNGAEVNSITGLLNNLLGSSSSSTTPTTIPLPPGF